MNIIVWSLLSKIFYCFSLQRRLWNGFSSLFCPALTDILRTAKMVKTFLNRANEKHYNVFQSDFNVDLNSRPANHHSILFGNARVEWN